MNFAIQGMAVILFSIPLALAAQSSSVTLPQDKGPDKINVSSYPPEQQKEYKVFVDKCSKCHTIARPINTTMNKVEWLFYLTRMMHKPSSGISSNERQVIFDFLIYDQENRKDKNPSAFFPNLSDTEIEKLKAGQH